MAYIGNNPDSVLQGRKALYTITATAGQTVFSGLDDNGNTIDLLQAESNNVYLNGSRLVDTADFTLNGDVLTLTSGAASGDIMVITTEQEMGNAASYTKAASDSRYINYDGDIVNGTIQMGGGPGNNITFADNNKIVMGDSNDFEIYHYPDVGNYIKGAGTYGNININAHEVKITDNGSNTVADFSTDNGSARLYWAGSGVKLATTTTGIDITGNVVVSGTVDGRDIAADGTKLDTVETNADVTDTTNVAAAGALMTTGGTMTGALIADDITSELTLAAIAKDISDPAVDIFVYNTAKDSDGGAWRKRTQHTSWYNETLNTSTRGARKEFPSVAVIVAEATQITIYDGDDPDMPMWMVFNLGSSYMINLAGTTRQIQAVQFLNGIMVVPLNGGANNGTIIVKFIEDFGYEIGAGYQRYGVQHAKIADRNVNATTFPQLSSVGIVSGNSNEVAMTVLPNAPIDPATGLPVPTIAVATQEGISVIQNTGVVVNILTEQNAAYNNTRDFFNVSFSPSGQLAFNSSQHGRTTGNYQNAVILKNPIDQYTSSSATYSKAPNSVQFTWTGEITTTTAAVDTGTNIGWHITSGVASNGIQAVFAGKHVALMTEETGLGLVDTDVLSGSSSLSCGVTSDYNTGWMNGDIKLATLSDTDATNVPGANLVTNGTFDSNINGWTSSGAAISWDASGRLKLVSASGNNPAYYPISCEIGKRYHVQLDFEGSWSFHLGTTTNSANDVGYIPHEGTTGNVTRYMFFTATQTTHYLVPYAIGANTAYIDNVSVTLAEEDRSVNGNSLQVFGAITKTAVATGADLVGYSGFSASNYLQHTVSTNYGSSAVVSFMGWQKTSDISNYQYMASLIDGTSGNMFGISINSSATGGVAGKPYFYDNVNGSLVATTRVDDGTWHFMVGVFDGTSKKLYIDGELNASATVTALAMTNVTNTNVGFYSPIVGGAISYPHLGSIALIRTSATAPTAAQIAKIYNDEKFLFQAGAQATLYGASDAVTALAYDDATELLHVGTSAGRSVFQGLRRIDNTTDAVGVAISASNGMVAED